MQRHHTAGSASEATTHAFAPTPRRSFVGALGAITCASLLGVQAPAQAPSLPLANLGLEHLDIVVPDTAVSAHFYMRLFDTALYQQPFRGSIRYFVLLGDLPEDRQVGYIAIGTAGDRPPQIGHYCALTRTYDRAAVASALEAAGYPAPMGGFGMIPDVDGIELQLFMPPAGLVAAAVPSDLPVEPTGLVRPRGLDHVLLQVADMGRSIDYYRFVYGTGLESEDPGNAARVWFNLESDTRIGLEPVRPGEMPRIAQFGIKVAPYDRGVVVAGLRAIGAEVLSSAEESGPVRLRDNNGIALELVAVRAAR